METFTSMNLLNFKFNKNNYTPIHHYNTINEKLHQEISNFTEKSKKNHFQENS